MRIEVIRPNASTAWKDLEGIFRGLPLEACPYEQNPITKESGWHAPLGKGFKMTGVFFTWSNFSNIENIVPPQKSVEMLKAKYPQEYLAFLAEENRDERSAIERLVCEDDQTEVVESFTGKWLVPFSAVPDLLPEPEGNNGAPLTHLAVRAETRTWYEEGYSLLLSDLLPDADVLVEHPENVGDPRWDQFYALAYPSQCQVEFVDIDEKEEGLYVPEPQGRDRLVVATVGDLIFSRSPKLVDPRWERPITPAEYRFEKETEARARKKRFQDSKRR